MSRSHGISRRSLLQGAAVTVAAGAAGFRSGPAFAQATQGVTDNEILIGALGQLSGPFAFIGAPGRDNMQLAIDKINEAGPINGRKLRMIFEHASSSGRERGRRQEAQRERQGVRAGDRDRQHRRGRRRRLCPRGRHPDLQHGGCDTDHPQSVRAQRLPWHHHGCRRQRAGHDRHRLPGGAERHQDRHPGRNLCVPAVASCRNPAAARQARRRGGGGRAIRRGGPRLHRAAHLVRPPARAGGPDPRQLHGSRLRHQAGPGKGPHQRDLRGRRLGREQCHHPADRRREHQERLGLFQRALFPDPDRRRRWRTTGAS